MPVTTPVVEPTVAIDVLLLLHIPPETEAVSVVVLPAHIELAPEIVAVALTVRGWYVPQPPTV